jgi:glutaredoxin
MTTTTQTGKKVQIDFMFIDLDVCTRCKGTEKNLETALQSVRSVLESAGVDVSVRKTLVETEDMARQLGFVSSPTIRVDGKDIALELRESSCATCGEACGCEGEIDCRVWLYQGKEYTVAPVPMIVDAILAAVYGTKEEMPTFSQPKAVPENLKRFFAGKAAKATSSCCNADEQAVCCEPAQKSTCCAPVESAQPAGCGCR